MTLTRLDLPRIDSVMARELALAQGVCVRPLLRRVHDRATGTEQTVALACGSTRETICKPCADKARRLRMTQCAEGWHRTDEPERPPAPTDSEDRAGDEDQADEDGAGAGERRVRSTRRQDVPDLPRVLQEDRTIGRAYMTPEGREFRPSMFLTLTLPSYGAVLPCGAPVNPQTYDYRRQALDALLFARLVDRFWQNLRRCAGYRVQHFAVVEPQRRLAPHLHAAIRGTVPRQTLRRVVAATYASVWWPAFDRPVYVHRQPVWDGTDYVDADTGQVLPTWAEAVDRLDGDPAAKPAHVLRFGRQVDMQGIIAPSADADRAVRYLTKYLTKSISDGPADGDAPDPRWVAHVDRLQVELQHLPCSERCANWLRYGIQPDHPGPGLRAGHCQSKAHDREHLGLGGRRVLVSRQWSGKTLGQHKADRATVVKEALLSAGIVPDDTAALAATVTLPDGSPRFVWTDTQPDAGTYLRAILDAIAHRVRWRQQYDTARTATANGAVDNRSATEPP